MANAGGTDANESTVLYAVRKEMTGYLGDGDTTEETILETPSLEQANDAALQELHGAPGVAAVSITHTKDGLIAGTGEKTDLTEEEVYVEKIDIRESDKANK